MDDRTESRRIAYEETEHCTDRTPGTFTIWRSPFNSPEQICEALTRRDGEQWLVWTTQHVGGQTGAWKYAVMAAGENNAHPLARDSHNRWYLAIDDGRRWGMLDIERTERLADFAEFVGQCDEQSAGCAADEEMARDMRHPDW